MKTISSEYRTEQLRKMFLDSKPVSESMPITFKEESRQWVTINCSCGKCGKEIPENMVRGNTASLIPSVVTLECVAFCKECLLLIHHTYRFREDGSVEFVNDDGVWVRSFGKEVNWKSKITGFIKNFLGLK